MLIQGILRLLVLIIAPTVENDIESAVTEQRNGWISYQVPAAPDTPSMCCWNSLEISGCDLMQEKQGFGLSNQAPMTESIHVYVKLKNAAPEVVMPVGDHCEVKTMGVNLKNLGELTSEVSVNWLKQQAMISQANDQVENGSLYALSIHEGVKASTALIELAELNRKGVSSQAIFWLGHRSQDTIESLKKLLNTLPNGETRRMINMALQQQDSPVAYELLQRIAKEDNDQEQQRDAIFWLGQSERLNGQVLLDMLTDPNMSSLYEPLVFSLSQNESGTDHLFTILQGDFDSSVKKHAIFWLTQSDDESVQNRLIQLL